MGEKGQINVLVIPVSTCTDSLCVEAESDVITASTQPVSRLIKSHRLLLCCLPVVAALVGFVCWLHQFLSLLTLKKQKRGAGLTTLTDW